VAAAKRKGTHFPYGQMNTSIISLAPSLFCIFSSYVKS
jgi:hypothetical protein